MHRLLKVKQGDVWEGLVRVGEVLLHLGLHLWRGDAGSLLVLEVGGLRELNEREQVHHALIELLLGLLNLLLVLRGLRGLLCLRGQIYNILSRRHLLQSLILKVLGELRLCFRGSVLLLDKSSNGGVDLT